MRAHFEGGAGGGTGAGSGGRLTRGRWRSCADVSHSRSRSLSDEATPRSLRRTSIVLPALGGCAVSLQIS